MWFFEPKSGARIKDRVFDEDALDGVEKKVASSAQPVKEIHDSAVEVMATVWEVCRQWDSSKFH